MGSLALPYESYAGGIRRRDAEPEAAVPPGPGDACTNGVVGKMAGAGLTRVAVIGRAEGGVGVSEAAARQRNCGCLMRTLRRVAPASTVIELSAPTTPDSLQANGQNWSEELVAKGVVAKAAKLLRPERLSDLATALSHVLLWSEFVAGDGAATDSLLVLEDDASLPESFCWADITNRLDAAPVGWDMISLFEFDPYRNRGKKKRLPKTWDSTPLKLCPAERSATAQLAAELSAATVRVRHHGLGMVGYVLSRAGGRELLEKVLPLKEQAIDQVLTDIIRKNRLRKPAIFVTHPPLVHHDYLLGSQRRDQNKAAKEGTTVANVVRAQVGPDTGLNVDEGEELALENEVGITDDGTSVSSALAEGASEVFAAGADLGAEDVLAASARGGLPHTPKLLTKTEKEALQSKVAERKGAGR